MRRQHGVIARSQLLELGIASGAIADRLKTGRLVRIHRGVYSPSPAPLSHRGRWMAAVLAVPGAVLSHRSAAQLWRLQRPRIEAVHMTCAGAGGGGRPGIVRHRARRLCPADLTRLHGIPVTSLPRTLLDLAEGEGRELRRALDEADRLGLLRLDELEAAIARNPGRRGIRPLRALIADYAGPTLTRSELEDRFLDLLREEGLPPPLVNATVAGIEVDAYWPRAGLVVELDGYDFHAGRRAFERDREREAAIREAGLDLLRFSWRQVTADPVRVLRLVGSRL